MSHKAIVLWDPKAHAKLASDDACTSILQYELPRAPSTIRPPYQSPHSADVKLRYVPPLVYYCINALAEYPDDMHALGAARLRYEAPWSHNQFDILSALIPTYRPFDGDAKDFDLTLVDPRLWAVIIQAYENLPPCFRQYTLPLSDAHVPLLQTIPSTKHFSLITTLSLTRCRMLTDDTILELRHLHTLAALDVSITAVGTWGISRLAKSLAWTEAEPTHPAERRGPWGLRILDLRDCMNVDDKVFYWLVRFPLLSVVDLRGTVCKPWQNLGLPFKACGETSLYYPTPLAKAIDRLAYNGETKSKLLFSHPTPFMLNINALHHKEGPRLSHLTSQSLNHLYRDTDDDSDGLVQFIGRRRDVFQPYERPLTPPVEQPSAVPAAHPGVPEYDSEDGRSEASHSDDESDDEDRDEDEIEDEGYLSPEPSRPWDMGADPMEEGFREFLRPPRPESPQSDDDWNGMVDVAEDEGRKYLQQRNAVMFYAHEPRRVSSMPDVAARHTQPQPKGDPLMLFRTPPPWSALPTSPPAKPASSKAASSSATHGMPTSVFASESANAIKRKRSGLQETAPVSADRARQRMHALSAIQSMYQMAQKRVGKEKAGVTSAQPRMVMPGRVNPFARTAQAGKQKTVPLVQKKASGASGEPSSSRVSASTRAPEVARADSAPSKMKPPQLPQAASSSSKAGTSAHTGPSTRPSKHPAEQDAPAEPPRPAKKLKPISTLTVPDWPNAKHKPITHHAPKPRPPPPKQQVQTTLEASRASAKLPDKAKAKRRVSAPVVSTPRLEMVPASAEKSGKSEGTKAKADKTSSKGEKGKGKEKKGVGFDWKNWGGR